MLLEVGLSCRPSIGLARWRDLPAEGVEAMDDGVHVCFLKVVENTPFVNLQRLYAECVQNQTTPRL